jgi:hypothetical protein
MRAVDVDWIAIPARPLFWMTLLTMLAELPRKTVMPFLAAN